MFDKIVQALLTSTLSHLSLPQSLAWPLMGLIYGLAQDGQLTTTYEEQVGGGAGQPELR